MRKAAIKIADHLAGWLTQDGRGYHFVYDPVYAAQPGARPISLTLPLREAPYTANVLFPFFDGLIPEDKYHGSYEQIGKAIQKYSTTPGLDVVNLFELVLFCFLIGNADMHLKNFSLLEQPGLGMTLSPAYDLVNTALVNPADEEEMALTLNGRKKKLTKRDFVAAMTMLKVEEKQQANIFNKMTKALPKWLELINLSFMSEAFKEQYKTILKVRMNRLQ